MTETLLKLTGVKQTFHQGETDLEVLRGIELELAGGEIVALTGPSGSGKSTLLQIAGLLEEAEAGDIVIGGRKANDLPEDARTLIRRGDLGFVYQYHHLLAEFSAAENIVIPQLIAGKSKSAARARAAELIAAMGLEARAGHRPARLSGGEQQRIAIARALANEPRILLADEPTGNLDPGTADDVFELLISLVRGAGLAALIATHNSTLAARMDRVLRLEDGMLVEG
ncbi:MAG: ABC transporter ATP-binding protein [Rhodospirillales bacterium]|jgi:lipoprotein-releasing system ATP-binding protein|nr:ABC transporter [Rhodospirillaceae bacterium]MDP6643489.1 ABC transporter ATP-binding protein [Rhodospirillales bacterium]MDP6842581.1 ABC transporter ATP-binding protein [Rhodospirillales bacterium]